MRSFARLSHAFKVVFWCLVAAVGVLSLMPVDRLPEQIFDIWDKAQHATGFAGLAGFARLGYPRTPTWRIVVGLLFYGALIEVAQAATGWRTGDVLDWLADSTGIGLGLALAAVIVSRTRPVRIDAQ
ncbi:MAG: VanZ family protein [Hydrogenophaga sp.]|nr:VanZ family protein [Hydrogenophaga sp.]